MELKYTVKDENYKTINQVLTNELKISTRLLAKLIHLKKIYLNGMLVDTRNNVKIGDLITVDFNYDEDNSNIVPKKMELKIVYEDEWLLIVNKPSGLAVHPSILYYEDSLSNGIRYYFDSINLKKKIRPVNRLDLNTSRLSCFCQMRIYSSNFKFANAIWYF